MYKITFFPSHRQISWILLTKRYSPTDNYFIAHGSHSNMFFLFIAVYIFRLAHRANA